MFRDIERLESGIRNSSFLKYTPPPLQHRQPFIHKQSHRRRRYTFSSFKQLQSKW